MSIPKFHKVSLVTEYTEIEAHQVTGPYDVIIKNHYAGVNFIEAYFRNGIHPAEFPFVLGREATNLVEASFAQFTKIQEDTVSVKKLAANTSDRELKLWTASLLQFITGITLVHEAYEVNANDYVLV
ncbi:hypothetical protein METBISCDRAFT_21181 [Metschnikowia bicuspidata]|uniref:Uncharacterized protein n=1 Tax=Metschnikowia bicuspidata TaxID=27322 RepID=A0A4P9ZL55_9ASCO|nr:hypothetical protein METBISCDRAFT_21181 [Metschnikowia bicuspidata]